MWQAIDEWHEKWVSVSWAGLFIWWAVFAFLILTR